MRTKNRFQERPLSSADGHGLIKTVYPPYHKNILIVSVECSKNLPYRMKSVSK